VAASAGNAVTWKVVYNHFPEIIKGMEGKAARIVAKTALDIEAGAKLRAPVDTGTLRASIQARKVSATHWIVTVGVDYGIYLEYGTRHMAARPYFAPAIRAVRASFNQAMKGVVA
jgi:HK97 gp10 family phage protein